MNKLNLTFDHIGIYAHDLSKMENFYTSVLEFTVTDRGQLLRENRPIDLIFLSRNPDQHHQIALVGGRPDDVSFNVVNQISLRCGDLSTLRELHRRVLAHGSTEIRSVTHGNALSIYVRDPDDNKLELFIDLPWYVEQPMVIPIDISVDDDKLFEELERHARSLRGFRSRAEWRIEIAQRMENRQSS